MIHRKYLSLLFMLIGMNILQDNLYAAVDYSNFYNNWKSLGLLSGALALSSVGSFYLYKNYKNIEPVDIVCKKEVIDVTKGIFGILGLAGSLSYAIGHYQQHNNSFYSDCFALKDYLPTILNALKENRCVNSPFIYYPLSFTALGHGLSSIVSFVGYALGYHNGIKQYPLFCMRNIPSREIKKKAKILSYSILLGIPAALLMYKNSDQWGGCNTINPAYMYNNWGSISLLSVIASITAIGGYCARQNNKREKQFKDNQQWLLSKSDIDDNSSKKFTTSKNNKNHTYWPIITGSNIKTTIGVFSLLSIGILSAYFVGAYNETLCLALRKIKNATPNNIENFTLVFNGAMAVLCTARYFKKDITQQDLLQVYGGCAIAAATSYGFAYFVRRLGTMLSA